MGEMFTIRLESLQLHGQAHSIQEVSPAHPNFLALYQLEAYFPNRKIGNVCPWLGKAKLSNGLNLLTERLNLNVWCKVVKGEKGQVRQVNPQIKVSSK